MTKIPNIRTGRVKIGGIGRSRRLLSVDLGQETCGTSGEVKENKLQINSGCPLSWVL